MELSQVPAYLAVIEYIDLAEITNISTQDFFSNETISTLTVTGYCIEADMDGIHVLKVCYINDLDGGANSSGLVIPISCVKSIQKLDTASEKIDYMGSETN